MNNTNVNVGAKPFAVPVELLKTFKKEVRFVPNVLPANGWIIFDRSMLISVLRDENIEARQNLARQIESLGKAGGELIVMQNIG